MSIYPVIRWMQREPNTFGYWSVWCCERGMGVPLTWFKSNWPLTHAQLPDHRTPKAFPQCWNFIQELAELRYASLFIFEFEKCQASAPVLLEWPFKNYSRESNPNFLQSLFASRRKKTEISCSMRKK